MFWSVFVFGLFHYLHSFYIPTKCEGGILDSPLGWLVGLWLVGLRQKFVWAKYLHIIYLCKVRNILSHLVVSMLFSWPLQQLIKVLETHVFRLGKLDQHDR